MAKLGCEDEAKKNMDNCKNDMEDETKKDNTTLNDNKFNDTTKKTGIDTRKEGDVLINNKKTPYEHVIESFEALNLLPEEILDATLSMNWNKPSKIQANALPVLIKGKNNLIAQAHHGSGKTGTFVIATLSLINLESNKLQSIILSHSRELANQTASVIGELGQYYSKLKIGIAIPKGHVSDDSQIIVGTPGTIYFNVLKEGKDLGNMLNGFKIFVVDEADEFLKRDNVKVNKKRSKFMKNKSKQYSLKDQMLNIYDILCKHKGNNFQKLLFSATFPKKVKELAFKIASPDPVFITLKKKDVALDNIKLYRIDCGGHNNNNNNIENNKFNTLLTLISLGNIGQAIVFVNTIKQAQYLIKKLENKNLKCSALYGSGMKTDIRDKTMKEFRQGNTICLIASNVIARGIDVPSVSLVVNYEIPIEMKKVNINDNNNNKSSQNALLFDSETFMHRVGRCGRFGQPGVCINLVDNKNDNDNLGYILKDFKLKCHVLEMNKNKMKTAIQSWLNTDDE